MLILLSIHIGTAFANIDPKTATAQFTELFEQMTILSPGTMPNNIKLAANLEKIYLILLLNTHQKG